MEVQYCTVEYKRYGHELVSGADMYVKSLEERLKVIKDSISNRTISDHTMQYTISSGLEKLVIKARCDLAEYRRWPSDLFTLSNVQLVQYGIVNGIA